MPNTEGGASSSQSQQHTFHARYKRKGVIGSGTYGKVYKVECLEDGMPYVMKKVTLAQNTEADKKQAMMEVDVLSALRHPHIVPYKECYWDEEEMDLCMVMDYCEGGDLYRYVQNRRKQGRKIEEDEAWLFMIQMMFALSYLHAKKILHRDVKSQNIFLSHGKCQLGDFGLAKKLEESFELARTPIGTPFYMAPEIMEGRPYAFKSDVWALGCVMYEVLTGKPAFAAKNFPGVAMKVLRGHYEPISEDYSPELRSVVSSMLCNNVNARPFIFQLIESPPIMTRAKNYLSLLETEQIQVGLMGTWRGAIPIITRQNVGNEHLQAIPEGESEGGSSQGSTPVKTGSPATVAATAVPAKSEAPFSPLRASATPRAADVQAGLARADAERGQPLSRQISSSSNSSLMAAWRGYAQEIMGVDTPLSATAAGVSTHRQQDNKKPTRPHTAHASTGRAAPFPVSASLDSGHMSGSGHAVTLPQATLHVEDLRLSLDATSAANTAIASSSTGHVGHSEHFSSGDHRNAFTLPAMSSGEHIEAAVMGATQPAHESEAAQPWHESELTSAKHALNEDERDTLRNQLEQLVVIAECVRQAGICDNSGDLGDAANADIDVWSEVVAAIDEAATQAPQAVVKPSPPNKTRVPSRAEGADDPDEGEEDAYSQEFDSVTEEDEGEEETEEEKARKREALDRRKEWREQQMRRDVQRQWHIQEAELVTEELSSVAITPNEMTSESDTDGATSDGDPECVEEEVISLAGQVVAEKAPANGLVWAVPPPPSTSNNQNAESKLEQRSQAQKRMADREQKLRRRCMEGLGPAVYARLYDFLKDRAKLYSEDDDVILRVELSEFLDDSQMAYWPLVDELVFYDQANKGM